MAAQQASGSLPWIGVDDPCELQRLQADHAVGQQETANFQLGGPEKFTGADARHVLQKHGVLADLWYMDDGDILCHPILVPSYLQESDVANARPHRKRKSSTAWTTWVHHLRSGELVTRRTRFLE